MEKGSVIPEKSLEDGSLQKIVLSNMSIRRKVVGEFLCLHHHLCSQILVDLCKDVYSG